VTADTGARAPARPFAAALLAGAAGAALALLAVRQAWAHAIYPAPRPLPTQTVTVTGQDLVPAAGALALAGLACLAAVIATRGTARRAAGVLLALCGAGAAAAASASLSTARVLATATAKASSQASAASGGAGSTTGGTATGSGTVVTGSHAAYAVLAGLPWRVAVFAGAAAIIGAGLATTWRGPRWPVMSSRYERPARQDRARRPPAAAGPAPAGPAPDGLAADGLAADGPAADGPALADPAALWDSISRGDDPTEAPPGRSPRGPAAG